MGGVLVNVTIPQLNKKCKQSIKFFLMFFFCVQKGEYERFFDANLHSRASGASGLHCLAAEAAEKGQGRERAGNNVAFAGAAY